MMTEIRFKINWASPSVIALIILMLIFIFAPTWRGCLNWYDYWDVRADKHISVPNAEYHRKREELYKAEMDAKIRAAKEKK